MFTGVKLDAVVLLVQDAFLAPLNDSQSMVAIENDSNLLDSEVFRFGERKVDQDDKPKHNREVDSVTLRRGASAMGIYTDGLEYGCYLLFPPNSIHNHRVYPEIH